MRLDRLRRGTAVFLLAFAFFDMAVVDVFFPQLCGDEQASNSFTSAIKSTKKLNQKIADEFAATRNQDSQPVQDSHQSSTDEDCFCCCAHIIPSPHVRVATLNCPPQLDNQAIMSFPASSPHGVFRPPRI